MNTAQFSENTYFEVLKNLYASLDGESNYFEFLEPIVELIRSQIDDPAFRSSYFSQDLLIHLDIVIKLREKQLKEKDLMDSYSTFLDILPRPFVYIDFKKEKTVYNKSVERVFRESPDTELSELREYVVENEGLRANTSEFGPRLFPWSFGDKELLLLLLSDRSNDSCLIEIISREDRLINENLVSEVYGLTAREASIATLLASGLNRKEIAAEFELSEYTVKTHVQNIYREIDVSSQLELSHRLLNGPALFYQINVNQEEKLYSDEIQKAKKVKLSDGRYIAYKEYGPSKGYPVLFFHNALGSRFQIHPDHSILKKLNIRMIVPERPGFGLSDYYKNRQLRDWPRDLEYLTQKLKLTKFSILSFGAGSPYAIACCEHFGGRIKSVALCSPVPEFIDAYDILSTRTSWGAAYLLLARLSPSLTERISSLVLQHSPEIYYENGVYPNLSDADKELYDDPQFKDMMVKAFSASFNNRARTWASDLFITTNPWNFDYSKLEHAIQFWYGEDDPWISSSLIELYLDQFPNGKKHFLPKESHWLIYRYWEKILYSLL